MKLKQSLQVGDTAGIQLVHACGNLLPDCMPESKKFRWHDLGNSRSVAVHYRMCPFSVQAVVTIGRHRFLHITADHVSVADDASFNCKGCASDQEQHYFLSKMEPSSTLPVIRLSWDSETLAERLRVAANTSGFFYLLDHGIEPEEIKQAFTLSKDFFQNAPNDERSKYAFDTSAGCVSCSHCLPHKIRLSPC